MTDWLKAGDKREEGESTSLASDRMRWDRYVYLCIFELGFCMDVNEDSGS